LEKDTTPALFFTPELEALRQQVREYDRQRLAHLYACRCDAGGWVDRTGDSPPGDMAVDLVAWEAGTRGGGSARVVSAEVFRHSAGRQWTHWRLYTPYEAVAFEAPLIP
jgi:hypothetical protein